MFTYNMIQTISFFNEQSLSKKPYGYIILTSYFLKYYVTLQNSSSIISLKNHYS